MGLVIDQTFARIGMETTAGGFAIKTTNAHFDMESHIASLNAHMELPRIEIDQHDTFSSEGLKSNPDMYAAAAQAGYGSAMDFIAKKMEDGKTYAAIESHVDAIAEIARRDTYRDHVYGVVVMPSIRPKITVVGGELTFNPDPITGDGMVNGHRGSYEPGSVESNYTPSKLSIFLQEYASISMKYQPDSTVDARL